MLMNTTDNTTPDNTLGAILLYLCDVSTRTKLFEGIADAMARLEPDDAKFLQHLKRNGFDTRKTAADRKLSLRDVELRARHVTRKYSTLLEQSGVVYELLNGTPPSIPDTPKVELTRQPCPLCRRELAVPIKAGCSVRCLECAMLWGTMTESDDGKRLTVKLYDIDEGLPITFDECFELFGTELYTPLDQTKAKFDQAMKFCDPNKVKTSSLKVVTEKHAQRLNHAWRTIWTIKTSPFGSR